jgi:hypothetical protein
MLHNLFIGRKRTLGDQKQSGVLYKGGIKMKAEKTNVYINNQNLQIFYRY